MFLLFKAFFYFSFKNLFFFIYFIYFFFIVYIFSFFFLFFLSFLCQYIFCCYFWQSPKMALSLVEVMYLVVRIIITKLWILQTQTKYSYRNWTLLVWNHTITNSLSCIKFLKHVLFLKTANSMPFYFEVTGWNSDR